MTRVVLVVLREQVHRLVARPAEALVDALASTRSMRSWNVAVFLERAARRRGHLHEDEPADPLRVLLQQPLDRVQPLQDALGVVEAVDADGQAVRRPAGPGARSTLRAALARPAASSRRSLGDGHSIEIG